MAKPQKSAPASTEDDGGATTGGPDAPHHIPAQPGGADEQITADPPAYGEVKEQVGQLRKQGIDAAGGEDDGKGDTDVPGTGVLVAEAPEPPEERQPEVTYDVAELEPLDSSEAWKEQTRVPTGDSQSGADVKSGHRAGEDSKVPPGDPEGDREKFASDPHASIEENAKRYQTISTRPDGTPSAGIGPNAVVQIPDDVPAPINPLSDATSHQDRVLYENWVNSEAENFANEARSRFINAAIAGKSLSITGDEDDGGEEKADELGVDDPGLQDGSGSDSTASAVDTDRDEQIITDDPNVNAGLTPKE